MERGRCGENRRNNIVYRTLINNILANQKIQQDIFFQYELSLVITVLEVTATADGVVLTWWCDSGRVILFNLMYFPKKIVLVLF